MKIRLNAWLLGALILGAPALGSAEAPQIIPSMKQGLHKVAQPDGTLVMVAGSYQDVTSYKRSLTFYFVEKNSTDWDHVPIYDVDDGYTLTWFSISSAETTVTDAILAVHSDGTYLIVAERPAKGSIVASWFKLVESDGSDDYGPARRMVKVGARAHARSKSIEQVLKAESVQKPASSGRQ